MKQSLFYPFLFCALVGCQALAVKNDSLSVKSAGIGEFIFAESIGSFENPDSCAGFDLSEKDLLEFFQKAQSVSFENGRYKSESEFSRCQARGSAELRNGREVFFTIDRARNSRLEYSEGNLTRHEYYYCGECSNDKFYAPKWNGSELRPIVKEIKIEENGAFSKIEDSWKEFTNPEACKNFALTEKDVLEFFNVARASSEHEISNILDASPCYASGSLILQNGKNATWYIDSSRRGMMLFPDSRSSRPLFFYGAKASSSLFAEVCDDDCLNAP